MSIEEKLYANLILGASNIKTAMLLARTFPVGELPDEEIINQALHKLSQRHDVTSFGIITKWRHSEFIRTTK